jgi:hypothetical protein
VELAVVGVLVSRALGNREIGGMLQMLLLLHTADILNLTKNMRLFVLMTLIRNTHNN